MKMDVTLPKTSLFFKEGGSDKVYHAEIVATEGGYLVNFRYGRRGAALTSGCKTPAPVDLVQATKVFEKLVKEKTSKGYTPDEAGSPYQGTENAGSKTDFVPQLLNAITEEEAMRLIEDDDWFCQEKMDGERRGAQANGNEIGMNRKGLQVPLPLEASQELAKICKDCGVIRVDSEEIGDTLHVFDLLENEGHSLCDMPALDRVYLAEEVLMDCTKLVVVPPAVTTVEKRALWNKVKAAHGEGIVFKRRDSKSKGGRPNSGGDWLKFKFTERATCLVSSISSSKRSVGLSLYGGQEATFCGNVTIPPNYPMPALEALVDVEYLYAYKGGSLFQPVYRGERHDLDITACSIEQLKYKPEGQECEE